VAGWRSRSGGALLAADPHLSVALPNVWLAVGMRSPTLNAVGLMPAGFPIMAIGRNRHIAWGGTSLHAAASDLFDVSGETLTEHTMTIRVRGGRPRKLRLRRSALGPVVSDGMMLRNAAPLALRWVGHTPSDEIGAMLGVMRAENSAGFAAALAGFAIPGQNMIHATADGHVGHLLALAAPRRPSAPPADLVLPPEAAAAWDDPAPSAAFPHRLDPPPGFVASANDAPPPGAVPAGFFFSPPDRVERLRALLGGTGTLDLDDMARSQTDVQGSPAAVRAVAARLPAHPVQALLLAWDGCYDVESEGAVLF
jgi:penicillin amidase